MAKTNANYTLGKAERLKSRKLIDALFKKGKVFNSFPFRVLYKFTDTGGGPLLAGFGVSSRNFKKSVDRNRIKRLTREAYRLQKNELASRLNRLSAAPNENNQGIEMKESGNQGRGLAVFFIYTGKELPDFTTVQQKMKKMLENLMAAVNETFSPNN